MNNVENEKSAAAAVQLATVDATPNKASLWTLALGSVGVVYGDIGTSPLYAFREAVMAAEPDGLVTRDIVLGVLSMILWALIVVVTVKYVLVLLRADNNGEGGTLSLTALAARAIGRRTTLVFLLGVIGASMFLGNSVITPAISVLSAVEGLKLISPAFEHYVVPLTIAILFGLFAGQSRGTAKVAAFFGPIMLVWFLAIAVAGLMHITDDPRVFYAINPWYGIRFVYEHGSHWAGDARRGVSGRDRGRGALRRSRSFRQETDPDCVAVCRAAGARAELFWPGRAGARPSGGHRQSVLPAGAGIGAVADGGARRPPRR